jgi:hypothetical protein
MTKTIEAEKCNQIKDKVYQKIQALCWRNTYPTVADHLKLLRQVDTCPHTEIQTSYYQTIVFEEFEIRIYNLCLHTIIIITYTCVQGSSDIYTVWTAGGGFYCLLENRLLGLMQSLVGKCFVENRGRPETPTTSKMLDQKLWGGKRSIQQKKPPRTIMC